MNDLLTGCFIAECIIMTNRQILNVPFLISIIVLMTFFHISNPTTFESPSNPPPHPRRWWF